MGGLVASSYVQQFGTNLTNNIITLATPYEGAPQLINATLHWRLLDDDMGSTFDKGLAFGSNIGLGLAGLQKEVKANFPSVAQLAPTKEYFKTSCWFGYPYTENKTKYYNAIDYKQYEKICLDIFDDNFKGAQTFHADIKNNGINILASYENSYFAIGINQPTISAIWFNDGISLGSLKCDNLSYEYIGDGTVPYQSSTMIEQLKNIENAKKRVLLKTASHSGMVNHGKNEVKTAEVMVWVGDILSDTPTKIQSDKITSKDYTVIKVACPVDITIKTENGVISSTSENFSEAAPFGRLDFIGENDDIKMLCLEGWDNYIVNLYGTSDGTMTYTIRWFDSDNELVDERVCDDVPVTANTIILTDTNNRTDTVLNIDNDGDGIIDQTRAAIPSTFDIQKSIVPTKGTLSVNSIILISIVVLLLLTVAIILLRKVARK